MTMGTNSCVDCPSCIPASEVAVRFGKDLGAPACLRYGHVFGKASTDTSTLRKIGAAFAKDCADYGAPKPLDGASAVDTITARVAGPSPRAMADSMEARATWTMPNADAPDSCFNCKFYLDESSTYRAFGWPAPLCTAKGRLLSPKRLQTEARECTMGVVGLTSGHSYVDDMTLLPVYADDFGWDLGVGDWSEDPDNIDPREYPTDRDLDADDISMGIRAWRKVEDPDGYGRPVFMPVFDYDSFDIVEQAKVPLTGNEAHPELYVDHQHFSYRLAVDWMELDEVPSFQGDAGTGKTEKIRHEAWKMVLPFDRINFNKSTEADQILGNWLFANGETVWKNGRIPTGWVARRVTCIDEPNRADTVIQEVFLPLTDNSKQLVLESCGVPVDDPETGERRWLTPPAMERGTYSFWAFCMNPAWDPKYHGTIELDQALVSRLCHYGMEYPPDEVEREILVRRYGLDEGKAPPKKTLDTVMGIALELRQLIKVGTLPISWGVREQIKVIRATPFFKLHDAYKRAVADYLEPQTRQQVLDVVTAHAH